MKRQAHLALIEQWGGLPAEGRVLKTDLFEKARSWPLNRLGWPPLIGLVRRALVAAQAFGRTRWRYRTGSFIAALARKPV